MVEACSASGQPAHTNSSACWYPELLIWGMETIRQMAFPPKHSGPGCPSDWQSIKVKRTGGDPAAALEIHQQMRSQLRKCRQLQHKGAKTLQRPGPSWLSALTEGKHCRFWGFWRTSSCTDTGDAGRGDAKPRSIVPPTSVLQCQPTFHLLGSNEKVHVGHLAQCMAHSRDVMTLTVLMTLMISRGTHNPPPPTSNHLTSLEVRFLWKKRDYSAVGIHHQITF